MFIKLAFTHLDLQKKSCYNNHIVKQKYVPKKTFIQTKFI